MGQSQNCVPWYPLPLTSNGARNGGGNELLEQPKHFDSLWLLAQYISWPLLFETLSLCNMRSHHCNYRLYTRSVLNAKMYLHSCFYAVLSQVDEELEALLENGEGLYDEKQVVSLCRLMVRVETMEQKLICLKLIQVWLDLWIRCLYCWFFFIFFFRL